MGQVTCIEVRNGEQVSVLRKDDVVVVGATGVLTLTEADFQKQRSMLRGLRKHSECQADDVVAVRNGDSHELWVVKTSGKVGTTGQHTSAQDIKERIEAVLQKNPQLDAQTLAYAGANNLLAFIKQLKTIETNN